MTRRSRAREIALQLLFQHDQNAQVDRPELEQFIRNRLLDAASQPFAQALYDGTIAHLSEIDPKLSAAAENWRLPRMAVVDRNILRLGAFEVLFTPETPTGVAINEAIELARRFGSRESPSFVNGVLDKLARSAIPSV